MNSRNLVRLFITTLLLGGVTAGIVGFVARWDEYRSLFASGDVGELFMTFFWLVGVGFIFSVISQMGFFAYLTIHRFGLGIFKTVKLWNAVQIVLIVFVLFDVVYFRFTAFSDGEGITGYIGWAIVLLAVGLIMAYLKMKQTNKQAFIPALFFMIVVTAVEWVPVLRINDNSWMYFMLIPLLICNSYQLLILTKLNEMSMKELALKRKK
ncbi:KinB-signaling pathway activation protein [Peribacillus saganii]|uniref:KinB-signaling pathway activation protein n=1 Tax=Peribacillus saganii TaxID=2303992 RepID=A0A372LNS1_9BACI|nr:KinB-signaling pathway activation protein [Peribacillus saganii]RFU68584.1 KinB-signaling pathway activation protein [Peribacillus saganii]